MGRETALVARGVGSSSSNVSGSVARLLRLGRADCMGCMAAHDMREAVRWCRTHLARITWSQDEKLCRVEVALDGRTARVWGVGAGLVEAYVECRAFVEEYEDGPPTKPFFRFD